MSDGPRGRLYGILGEFADPERLIAAIHAARERGYRRMEAYTPYPIPEVAEALRFRRTFIPTLVLLGGIVGCVGGYYMQYYLMAVNYPLNVGGRPLDSWPMFIPITFELTVLCAGLSAFVGMLALNGLPRLHHPLFEIERFSLVSRDRFFLCIEAADRRFEPELIRAFLREQDARGVTDVDAQER